MSVYGSRLLGKTDVVPGLFYVATKCGHINYIPLIPMQSYVVLSKSGSSFRGVPIPMSFKSYGMAWLRFIGWVTVIIGAVIVMVGATAHQPARSDDWMPGVLVALVGGGILFLAYKFKPLTHASYDRACALAQLVGLKEEGMARIRTIYGMSPKTAPIAPKAQAPTQTRVPLPSQRR